MRTTTTLEADVVQQLEACRAAVGQSQKELVNQALRIGLSVIAKAKAVEGKFEVRPLDLHFWSGIDEDGLNQLADELETTAQMALARQ